LLHVDPFMWRRRAPVLAHRLQASRVPMPASEGRSRMPIHRLIGRVLSGRESPIRGVRRAPAGGGPESGARVVVGLAVTLWLGSAGVAFAQAVDTTLWVTNGTVFSVVRDRTTIYIGGSFTQVGPATGGGLAIDASTGAAQQPYPKVTGNVY